MKMNPEVKAQWVAALRSGKYPQGTGVLQTTTGKFCCLGVLADLHNPKGWAPKRDSICHEGFAGLPSDEVLKWAGFEKAKDIQNKAYVCQGIHNEYSIPVVSLRNGLQGPRPLANWNDLGTSFAEIADAIEEQL